MIGCYTFPSIFYVPISTFCTLLCGVNARWTFEGTFFIFLIVFVIKDRSLARMAFSLLRLCWIFVCFRRILTLVLNQSYFLFFLAHWCFFVFRTVLTVFPFTQALTNGFIIPVLFLSVVWKTTYIFFPFTSSHPLLTRNAFLFAQWEPKILWAPGTILVIEFVDLTGGTGRWAFDADEGWRGGEQIGSIRAVGLVVGGKREKK